MQVMILTHFVVAKNSGKVQMSLPPLHPPPPHHLHCLLTSLILEEEVSKNLNNSRCDTIHICHILSNHALLCKKGKAVMCLNQSPR